MFSHPHDIYGKGIDMGYQRGFNCTKCDHNICCDLTIVDSELVGDAHLLTISICTVPGPQNMECDISLSCTAEKLSSELKTNSESELASSGQSYTIPNPNPTVGFFYENQQFSLDAAGYGTVTLAISDEQIPMHYVDVSFSINPPGMSQCKDNDHII